MVVLEYLKYILIILKREVGVYITRGYNYTFTYSTALFWLSIHDESLCSVSYTPAFPAFRFFLPASTSPRSSYSSSSSSQLQRLPPTSLPLLTITSSILPPFAILPFSMFPAVGKTRQRKLPVQTSLWTAYEGEGGRSI